MTFETDFRARLLADSGIDALIGKKPGAKSIDWNERQQGAPHPSIVLEVVIAGMSQHMGGFNQYQPTRTQLRCTATDRGKAIALRNAVIDCIVPGAIQGGTEFKRAQNVSHFPRTQKVETETLHHEIIDAEFWHAST